MWKTWLGQLWGSLSVREKLGQVTYRGGTHCQLSSRGQFSARETRSGQPLVHCQFLRNKDRSTIGLFPLRKKHTLLTHL